MPEEDRDQLYITFYDILNGLRAQPNIDIYVTGSNSKMLSKDIVTYFRDRGSEIRVYPLSFAEYYAFAGLEKADALEQYLTFGGMPLAVLEPKENEKRKYLTDLHKNVYIKDIVERYKLKDDVVIDALTNAIYSAVGSLSNPHKLVNTIKTVMSLETTDPTIKAYLEYLEDAYLVSVAERYDIKGKRYFENIKKYYAMDLGLRNARLNFRQQERSHLMENLIFNELIRRGFSVDVGVVEVERMIDGKRQQVQYEIDFIVNTGKEKLYIQSALNIDTDEKKQQETFSLHHIRDSFRKIVIVDGNAKPWIDENGITYAVSCRHCTDPLCVKSCIAGALSKKDGVIEIDHSKCVGCLTCVLVCPYGAVVEGESGAAQKCELCMKNTCGAPACVKGCPNGAIVYEERGEEQ